jgi:hypothetical protein
VRGGDADRHAAADHDANTARAADTDQHPRRKRLLSMSIELRGAG